MPALTAVLGLLGMACGPTAPDPTGAADAGSARADAAPGAPDADPGPGPGSAWAIALGGPGDDPGSSVAVAPDGAVYVGFYFTGTIEVAGRMLAGGCATDHYSSAVARIERDGTVAWATSIPGTECAHVTALAAAGNDGVVVAGEVYGPTSLGGEPVETSDLGWPYLLRLDAAGAPRWSSLGRAAEANLTYSVAAAADGRVAAVGFYRVGLDLGAGPLPPAQLHRGFAALYTPDGAIAWSRAVGGDEHLYLTDVAFGDDGTLVVVGALRGQLPLAGTTVGAPGPVGPYDGLAIHVAPADGAPLAAWRIPGEVGLLQVALASDAVFVTGNTAGDLDLGGGHLPIDTDGVFAARFDRDGTHRWSTVVAAEDGGGVGASSLALGRQVVVGGSFYGRARIGGDPISAAYPGLNDGFVVALDRDHGTIAWTELATGPGDDVVTSVAADDDAWVAAGSHSTGVTVAGHPLDAAGGYDTFVVRNLWPAAGDPTVP